MVPSARYLATPVEEDLDAAMVFVGGPRQVGKTTFALQFLEEGSERHPAYFNWDNPKDRPRLRRGELPPHERTIVLDEVHKYARWRNLVKGLYDREKSSRRFLITGSARLDYYRKGGDSLHGRYHYYRLHPFSPRELDPRPGPEVVEQLLKFGGFPQPFFRAQEKFWRRWQRERLDRVLREDLRDLERVREVSLIETLLDLLPSRVGSPLSVQSLREDVNVAHDTVDRWIDILDRLYLCFRISPFGSPRVRAVRKERKLYFWDWSALPEGGARIENFVACQLLKYCHWMEDTEGYRMDLRFLRDTDGREIDFVVLKERRPIFAVECKTGEKAISPAIRYFRERTPIPRFFQIHMGQKDFGHDATDVRVLPIHTFCTELELP